MIVGPTTTSVQARSTLNAMLAEVAAQAATDAGATHEIVRAFDPFDAEQEVARYMRANLIVYQMPVW